MSDDEKTAHLTSPAGDPHRVASDRDVPKPHDTRSARDVEEIDVWASVLSGLIDVRRRSFREQLGTAVASVLMQHPNLSAEQLAEHVPSKLCQWHEGQTPAWHVDEVLRDLEVAGAVRRDTYHRPRSGPVLWLVDTRLKAKLDALGLTDHAALRGPRFQPEGRGRRSRSDLRGPR